MCSKPESKIKWNKTDCIGKTHCEWTCLQNELGSTPIFCNHCAILDPSLSSLSLNAPKTPISINGTEVLCHPGDKLIDVIRAAGYPVPSLCHHPILPPSGACRLCLVEVIAEGCNRTVTACDYEVSVPIAVKTDTPRILRHRRVIVEMLLSEAPEAHRIQSLAREVGLLPAAGPSQYVSKTDRPPTQGKNPGCVLCGRCVRVCESVTHCGVLEMCGRASDLRPARAFDADDDPACTKCGACVAICPTGAMKVPPSSASSASTCELCVLICPDAAVLRDPITGEIEIDSARCKKCGLCVHYCPTKALRSNISCDR